MNNVEPKSREALAALEPVLKASEAVMGFVPNSMLTMGHMPQLTMAFSVLAATVFGSDLRNTMDAYQAHVPSDDDTASALPPDLVQLIAYSVSLRAGCRYCQAHTSHNAHRAGLSEEQLNAVLDYAASDVFDDAQKAAIGLALAAGGVPNDASPEHFVALRAHFNERQIVQIVGVISLFGFLNRWNDTMATALEETPLNFATAGLSDWQVGKHA